MTDPDIVETHLALTRRALTPSASLSARVRARLAVESTASGASHLAATPVELPPSLRRTLRASGKAGAVLSAGLLGLGFVAGYVARGADTMEPPPLPVAPIEERAASIEQDLAPSAVAEVAKGVRSKRQSARPRGASSPGPAPAAPAPSRHGAQEELALLRRAERAVRAGNSALALALTGELEVRYPRTRLLEERRAIELMAHCEARDADASARAARFLREHPQSVYAGRIITLCPVETASREPASR